jgi:sugar phosphate isomerase/epimerase
VEYCSLAAAGVPAAAMLSKVILLHASPIAKSSPFVSFPSAPHDRIAVASYPFREFVAGKDHKPGNPTIELKDFAAHVTEKFGVRRIEPWSAHFPAIDPKYLDQFRAKLEAAHAGLANIAVDGEESPYAADRTERDNSAAFGKKWIDVAATIGSPSVRTNIPQARDAKPDITRLTETLRQVAEHGEKKNVVVHLENDNPISEDPFFLVQVIEEINSPWLRALPDFGNTLNAHDEDYSYRAIDAMFAHAYGICHVKDGEVNENGIASHVNLARTFHILKLREYQGYCSIEYDALGDPYKATSQLIEKTERYLSQG